MQNPNRRLAGSLRQLTLVATLSVGTVFAQDKAIVQDALIVPDATITQDTRQGMVPRQDMVPIGWEGKLRFHAKSAYGPAALARAAVSNAYLLGIDSPPEWGQDGLGYGQRLGSTLAHSGVRNLIGFSLDSALHQDPRYYRSTDRGVWRRTMHAFRGTILTHKDSGGETLSTWRLGSAYGAAFISNEWRPDRGNTLAQGFSKAPLNLASICCQNVGREFWPDIKGKLLRAQALVQPYLYDPPWSLDAGPSCGQNDRTREIYNRASLNGRLRALSWSGERSRKNIPDKNCKSGRSVNLAGRGNLTMRITSADNTMSPSGTRETQAAAVDSFLPPDVVIGSPRAGTLDRRSFTRHNFKEMEWSVGSMRTRLGRVIFLHFAGVLGVAGFASAAHVESPVPSAESIIAHMMQARSENRARLRPYSVTRDYRLFGKEQQTARSEVIARVTFDPPGIKQFVIQQASGMGLGERIVRQMLEHETEIGKNNSTTDLSPVNYEFRYLREEELDGRSCYVLEIVPRRKDKTLLRGHIWVDAITYLLHRTEGEPARSPSWWLKDARVVLVYSDVGGMWLQTSSESSAEVRFLGHHTMLSRDVEYSMSALAASTRVAPRGQ